MSEKEDFKETIKYMIEITYVRGYEDAQAGMPQELGLRLLREDYEKAKNRLKK